MKIALVHEYLTAIGGAERVLLALLEIFPQADVYTSIYNPDVILLPKKTKVYTSYIQNLPFADQKRQLYLALMPKAFESFDFSDYDLVISDSHSFAKGVKTDPETLHICYCHTPTRYLWLNPKKHIKDSHYNPLVKKIIPWIIEKIKRWDLMAAQRPQRMIANSQIVAKRIKKIYKRKSQVIYPPVNFQDFRISKKISDYYILVSRFEPYKKVDVAIEAFNKLGKKLIIIGSGSGEKKLKKIANKNIIFVGGIDDKRKIKYFENAKALIFPQEEDFGITAVEAQSAGRPVVAYNAGGAKETIIDGQTGILFQFQTANSIIDAVHKLEKTKFDSQKIRKHAEQFRKKRFQSEIKSYIMSSYSAWKKHNKKWQDFRGV